MKTLNKGLPYSRFSQWRMFAFVFGIAVCPIALGTNISLVPSDWHLLSYNGIPSHSIASDDRGLAISVKRSASPLVTMLPAPVSLSEITIQATINGALELPDRPQGSKGADDFRLRVGLIFAGDQVLDPFQLSIAPSWLKRLSALLPAGIGVSHVQFLNTYLDTDLANLERRHPTTKLWHERFVLQIDKDGRIRQRMNINEEANLIGIWISTDGDDTGSCFNVRIERISFH